MVALVGVGSAVSVAASWSGSEGPLSHQTMPSTADTTTASTPAMRAGEFHQGDEGGADRAAWVVGRGVARC